MTNLDQSIIEYQKAGWILTYRDQQSAQFQGSKPSAGILSIILLWILSLPIGIIYLIYSGKQSNPTITLYYDKEGKLKSTKPPRQKGIGFFVFLAILLNILIVLPLCLIFVIVPIAGETTGIIQALVL